jgi:hypothetical protein
LASRTKTGLAFLGCLSAVALAACGQSAADQQRAADFPPDSCVVIQGNESVDLETSITRVPCEAYHTHVVVSIAPNGEPCPIEPGLENRMGFCVRSALPSPTPYPGGVTAP